VDLGGEVGGKNGERVFERKTVRRVSEYCSCVEGGWGG